MRVLTVLLYDLLNATRISEIRYDRANRMRRLLICIGVFLFCLLILGVVYFEVRLVMEHTGVDMDLPVRICILAFSVISALFTVRGILYTSANLTRIGALPFSDLEVLFVRCLEALFQNVLFVLMLCICLSFAIFTAAEERLTFVCTCMLLPPSAFRIIHALFLLRQKNTIIPKQKKAGIAVILAVALAAAYIMLQLHISSALLIAAWAAVVISGIFMLHITHGCFYDIVAQNQPAEKEYSLNTADQTQEQALYAKELRMYLGDKLYMVNSSFGAFVLLAAAVCLAALPLDSLFPETAGIIYQCLPMLFALIISTCCTTYCSFSLEGKTRWIYQSAPVSAMQVTISKIAVNLTISVPAVLIAACICSVRSLRSDLIIFLMSFIIPFLSAVIVSAFGCLIDMLLCNTEWENAQVLMKQTKNYPITLFGALYLNGLAGAALYFLKDTLGLRLIYVIICALYLLILSVLYFCVKKKAGSFRFERN